MQVDRVCGTTETSTGVTETGSQGVLDFKRSHSDLGANSPSWLSILGCQTRHSSICNFHGQHGAPPNCSTVDEKIAGIITCEM